MKTIDKNNYEAYYLDFLEGRLNESHTILLMTFLDQFPELRIDNELVNLEQKSIFLDESYKQSLKQVLFEEELVTKSTINSFLIAQTENILSPTKIKEVEQFIVNNPSYLIEQQLFQASHLKVNKQDVYKEKSALKKTSVIPLRMIMTAFAVAASVALFFLIGDFSTSPRARNTQSSASKQPSQINVADTKDLDKKIKKQNVINTLHQSILEDYHSAVDSTHANNSAYSSAQNFEKENIVLPTLSVVEINPREVDTVFTDTKLANSNNNLTARKDQENAQEFSALGFNQMKNPITPITAQLSKLIKKDIDFRTAAPTLKHSGGFYFKIGTFVVSRTSS